MSDLIITDNLKKLVKERYYQKNETIPQQMIRRVADFIASGEKYYNYNESQIAQLSDQYYNTINEKYWIPSSPYLMSAGTKNPMTSACFVIGGLEDNMKNIYETLTRQGMVNKQGGGTGFNFSNLREKGSVIGSTGGTSSGVLSFLELFNKNGDVVKQGGRRRSANMGVMFYTHPDIVEFIDCKKENSEFNNFNLSVLIDNKFLKMVENNEDYDLISPKNNQPVGKQNAKELFEKICYNSWKNGEPAIINKDTLNENNPMKEYLGDIVCTNPCGEIPLFEDEACILASLNLEKFVDWNGNVNYKKLKEIVSLVTRFLDTSIDVSIYPDKKIENKVKSLRRLGLGIMSLHGALAKAGLKYSSEKGRKFAKHLQQKINEYSWESSYELALEKGVFPLWKHSSFEIEYRNIATTTIAPTGTIQQILNTSSGGCEPMFALTYERIIDDEVTYWVNPFFEEYAKYHGFWTDDLAQKVSENNGSAKGVYLIPKKHQEVLEIASEIESINHVKMQAELQKYVDNSISKTINLPKEATVEDVKDAYRLGMSLGCKGLTVYRDGSRENQVMSTGKTNKTVNEINGIKDDLSNLPWGTTIKASNDLIGKKHRVVSGCGNVHVKAFFSPVDGRLMEVFLSKGDSGGCNSWMNSNSRLISAALRTGMGFDYLIDQLKSIDTCPSYAVRRATKKDTAKGNCCPTAVANALIKMQEEMLDELEDRENEEDVISDQKEEVKTELNKAIIKTEENKCPECGEKTQMESGCISCKACGYSKCN